MVEAGAGAAPGAASSSARPAVPKGVLAWVEPTSERALGALEAQARLPFRTSAGRRGCAPPSAARAGGTGEQPSKPRCRGGGGLGCWGGIGGAGLG